MDNHTTWTNCTASPVKFDFKKTLEAMEKHRAAMSEIPTGYVMTTETLERIKDEVDKHLSDPHRTAAMPRFFMGVPIEDYPTARECFDRMMTQRPGERLQLVVGDIPVDCLDHP